jgi:hypothetical protein
MKLWSKSGGRTRRVVRKFQGRNAIVNVHVEYVVIFFPFVQLPSPRTDRIHDLSDFLPGLGRPLSYRPCETGIRKGSVKHEELT